MSAAFQFSAALKAMDVLERCVLAEGRHTTYLELAESMGHGSRHVRAMGQVTSRIDAACFYAGLPFLAAAWVRKDDGTINPSSFSSGIWLPHRDVLTQAALKWPWSAADFGRIRKMLSSSLADEAATKLWERIEEFGEKAIQKALSVREHAVERPDLAG